MLVCRHDSPARCRICRVQLISATTALNIRTPLSLYKKYHSVSHFVSFLSLSGPSQKPALSSGPLIQNVHSSKRILFSIVHDKSGMAMLTGS